MKKVTVNFIMSMAIVILMLFLIIILGVASKEISKETNSVKHEVSVTRQKEEIGDVEGYGMIVNGITYGFGSLAGIVLAVVEILIGAYAILLFVFAVIARKVFVKQGKGLMTYRILMGVEYILQGGIVLFCANSMSLFCIILAVLIVAEITYGCINTYTDRILE